MKQAAPSSPAPPPGARDALAGLDDEQFGRLEKFAVILATDGVERGLIGPRETPRLWERHLLNCAALAPAVSANARVCDIGSGAGLPGVVLALCRLDLEVTLLEPLLRRATFLNETVTALGLSDQVRVERGRAEEWHGRDTFDVVTARAVAPLDRLLGWSMPLVTAQGELLAMKGSSAEAEIEAAGATLRRLRCATPEVLELSLTGPAGPTSTTRVIRVAYADRTRVS